MNTDKDTANYLDADETSENDETSDKHSEIDLRVVPKSSTEEYDEYADGDSSDEEDIRNTIGKSWLLYWSNCICWTIDCTVLLILFNVLDESKILVV